MNHKTFFPALVLSAVSATATDLADWYAFKPDNNITAPSAVGLADWNTEPAGKHGRIERRDDKLFYAGKEFKLWGANLGFADSKPTKAEAERMAEFFRKYGFNALRHHKHLDGYGWAGFQGPFSMLDFDAEGLDRFDYFNKCLKDAGIFIKHSPNFGVRFGREDFPRVPYHAELGSVEDRPGARIRAPFGMVYLAREIQDLQIEQTVKLLRHRNPHTGMLYAEDPFLFCVELFNEDSVLFGGTNSSLQISSTIRARTAKAFSAWLLERYKSDAAWRTAWGEEAVIADPANIPNDHLRNLVAPAKVNGDFPAESLASGTVVPWASPWFNDAALDPASEQAFLRARLLDSMEFLIELQDGFYRRFAMAVRETGFKGEIVTSNWQAGSLAGHLLNLHSDARSGMVDRHNYFGGRDGAMDGKNTFRHASILTRPGGGNLSAGFQQVEGAAFMLSEWIHVQPNEWYAEGPVTLGAYGWGLQGWDVSYWFQIGTTRGVFSDRIGRNPWDSSNPVGLATLPVVSRMVRRLDVAEAPRTHYLNAHIPSVREGRMSFLGTTVQDHDEKVFSTDKVPVEALAATRVAVRFTEQETPTETFDLKPYQEGDTVVSATKQLRWTRGEADNPHSGFFTINTAATKGFVGFAPGGKTFELGDGYAITPERGFAVILLTAKGERETLADAKEIVLTAMARGRNTGMKLNEVGNRVTARGTPPLLLEPVKATLEVPFNGSLLVLDHDGNAPTATRAVIRTFLIDGAMDRSPFYLLRR